MSTAHKTEEEKKEYFDAPDVLDQKIKKLAEMIKSASHFIAFTGAGISTSAGIPDFRSGINTVLPTGPGVWEKRAVGEKNAPKPKVAATPMHSAVPTPTHMALCALEQRGLLKFLVSQNVDGLHRKSGFPPSKLAELHGNTNLEVCKKCGRKFMRDFRTRNAEKVHDHRTGRSCDDPKCKGELHDSIINFGENLPQQELEDGFAHSETADLCLALGSSLRVTPAADMPATTARKGKLVIINLQSTPLDGVAYMKINAMVDQVIKRLMEILDIPIPAFTLKRWFGVSRVAIAAGKAMVDKIAIRGLDQNKNHFSFFKKIDVTFDKPVPKTLAFAREPFVFGAGDVDMTQKGRATFTFQGHYNEPNFTFDLNPADFKLSEERIFEMEYDPAQGKWIRFAELPKA